MKRSAFIKAATAAAMWPYAGVARAESPAGSVTDEVLRREIRAGFRRLDEIFWVPELANWLDRPGKDLRGHFEGRINPPWWSCANAVETMVDFMDLTGGSEFDGQLRELHAGNVLRGSRIPRLTETLIARGDWKDEDDRRLRRAIREADPKSTHRTEFRNEYLDDSAWWGIGWLRFHERTRDSRYLRTAIAIQKHMVDNWQPRGGVSWAEDADKRDPNSITNSLFVVLSARLFLVTRDREFLRWAEKTIAWEKEAKLYDGTGIVDRPGHQGDYWTYNQGAYLGGLEALHAATGKRVWLDEAAAVATTIIERSGIVREDGVLFEKLGTDGWDVGLFKGVCARYFGRLRRTFARLKIHPEVEKSLSRVLRASAGAILTLPRTDELLPLEWHRPPRAEIANFNTELSALTALEAAIGTVE